MTTRHPLRWKVAGAVAFPLLLMTVYLLWIWPRPRGSSMVAELAPYLVALLAGLPFAWSFAPPARRWLILTLYVICGLTVLWIYALMILCGVKDVCL